MFMFVLVSVVLHLGMGFWGCWTVLVAVLVSISSFLVVFRPLFFGIWEHHCLLHTCGTLCYTYVCTVFLGVLDRFGGCFGLDILVSGCVSAASFWHFGAPLCVAHLPNVAL